MLNVWWDVELLLCQKCTAMSVGERILKICQHLAEYSGTFFGTQRISSECNVSEMYVLLLFF